MKTIYIVLICIAAYLIGSINFASIISHIKNKDIRKLGSGNPGTMNVLRSVGKIWGVLTFILDACKGLSFALIGRYLINGKDNFPMLILLGFLVVLGHIFPIYTKFKGGKGVASTIGIYIAMNPIAGVITLVALIVFLFGIKYGFIGSILAVTAFMIHAIILCKDTPFAIVLIIIMWLMVFIAHRSNISRMIKGEENKLNLLGKNEVKILNDENKKEEEKE